MGSDQKCPFVAHMQMHVDAKCVTDRAVNH